MQMMITNEMIISKYSFFVRKKTRIKGEFGTKRFCAANDHGNYCKYIKQPTGEREYRSCVLTCDSENCNSSTIPMSDQYLFLTAVAVSIITMINSISENRFLNICNKR